MQVRIPSPDVLHPPLGLYAHAHWVPNDAALLFLSGQVGIRPDGVTPAALAEQTEQALLNVGEILRANDMSFDNVVKFTWYLVAGQSFADLRAARLKFFGEVRPCSTAMFVSALAMPEWLVEVEAIASVAHRNSDA